jgi:stage V sporulation protein R
MNRTRPISGELLRLKEEILTYALEYGLDFHDVRFEVCDYDTINILAAQGGFPTRYPHWRFGMEYDQLSKNYAYGLSKIYEMVINTNPCYAYLLNVNNIVDQKLVMAHVYGHADFFKNNYWFKATNKSMMDVMANHGTKIRRYMEKHGQDKVESFIDSVLSLENLLDPNVLFENELGEDPIEEDDFDPQEGDDRSQALKSFMDSQLFRKGRKKNNKKNGGDKLGQGASKLPTRDIMKFIMGFAPLEEWESDIVGILREESYYFLPQRLTKIMNEGWASYWHSKIMTQKALKSSEIVDFADQHAGVMAMSRKQINPYKIGIELFRDIEYRWDTGRFGKEYQECRNMVEKNKWDKKLGLGKEKIFEIRKSHNDITFIDQFFTQDFCERQSLFTYRFNPRTGRNEINSIEFKKIKEKLLGQLTNFGSPVIEIETSNYGNRGELLLKHIHQGVDLDMGMGSDTMRNIFTLWKRPVNLSTTFDGNETVYVFDGKEIKTR